MQFLVLPKETFNLWNYQVQAGLFGLFYTERCIMRDYQKGLTLRDIPRTAVQRSDTSLLQTVNPSAEGHKQLPAQRSSSSLPCLRPGLEGLGERGCTSHCWGTNPHWWPALGMAGTGLLLCATRTWCCFQQWDCEINHFFFRLQRQTGIKEPGLF